MMTVTNLKLPFLGKLLTYWQIQWQCGRNRTWKSCGISQTLAENTPKSNRSINNKTTGNNKQDNVYIINAIKQLY